MDWKQIAKDKCARLGVSCEEHGSGLMVSGKPMMLTGVEDLPEKYEHSLNDLIDYRLAALLRSENDIYGVLFDRKIA